MSIYNLTYSKLGQQLLPPDKRNPKLIAFVNCLLSPMQWLRDLWFGTYRTGASGPYNSGTTYAKYAQVVYNKVVYSSLQGSNTGNTPGVNSAWWTPIQNIFIGLNERIMYNGQCLVLTWALNKWFGTNFVQPPNTGTSDIYITNNTISPAYFVSGSIGNSSYVYANYSPQYIINDYSLTPVANFTIYVPSAVYNALASTDANRQSIFKAFVNQYVPAGMIYNISTY